MEKVYLDSLKMHEANAGKITMKSKVPVTNKEELSLAYSPGVAAPCLEISKDETLLRKYTSIGNTVAVITDGSAVLGLGDIGPKASMPVMEGKSILLKEFADVNSFPICINTNDVEEIIATIKNISYSFGAINLEDISAPRCVEIERRLIEELDIPVFHDDQHGTAIVTLAALINTNKITNKSLDSEIVVCGTGAAGSSIIKLLHKYGYRNIYGINHKGILCKDRINELDVLEVELLEYVKDATGNMEDLVKGKDIFIGVSAGDLLSEEMVKSMNEPVIFAMANPTPEINPKIALDAGAIVIGTGRSDYPNQVNNVLAFPGIFKGVLDSGKSKITDEMKIEAAKAIAATIKDEDVRNDYVIPSPFNKDVVKNVANAIINMEEK